MSQQLVFHRADMDLIAAFAGCTLDEKPGSNWVQDNGGLPDYICQIARAIKRSGKTTSSAISIAVNRVKVWATGKGVDHDTQMKAAAAVAEWEKLKGKAKVKKAAKDAAHVAATGPSTPVLMLADTAVDYPVDIVTQAFTDQTRGARDAWRKANPNASYDDPDCPPYMWVKEQWNTFLIIQNDYGKYPKLQKVAYSVGDDMAVSFGAPVEVKTEYIVVDPDELGGADLTDEDLQKMMELAGPCPKTPVHTLLQLTPRPSALDRILTLAQQRR